MKHIKKILFLISHQKNSKLISNARDIINEKDSSIKEKLEFLLKLNPVEIEREFNLKLERLKSKNIVYISVLDDEYPALLRHIKDYPLGLFCNGDISLLNRELLSVVGTRKPSYDGRKMCDQLLRHISRTDLVMVSGLAFGIDELIHKACLKYKVPTISVIPGTVEAPVPVQNRYIAKLIIQKGGLIISEKPHDHTIKKYSYVERNRIISGMSKKLFVVEAAIKSGSMTSANHAAEQGREVLAMPGSISNEVAKGCNYLIYNGATPIYEPSQIIEVKEQQKIIRKSDSKIIDYLQDKSKVLIDELIIELEMSARDLMLEIKKLELRGEIRRFGQYVELE